MKRACRCTTSARAWQVAWTCSVAMTTSTVEVMATHTLLELPSTALYSGAWLVRARSAIVQGEAWATESWRGMESDAAQWVGTPSMSVMQKSPLPPSGSKHDYMSLDK